MADKILLVDDEAALRKVITHAFQRDGLEVVQASDGEEAVDLIDGGQAFDALVTDVQMPGEVNGIQLAEHARAAAPDMAVVIMSGDTAGLPIPDLGEHGAFLAKPFRLAALVRLVRDLLSGFREGLRFPKASPNRARVHRPAQH